MMTRIDFYHLQRQSLEEVLPKLLLKAYGLGKKIKVRVGDDSKLEYINSLLWTFNDESFLPHGSKKDGFASQQPIWLSIEDSNPNEAEFLFLIYGAIEDFESIEKYERIFNIFDGNSEADVVLARNFWKGCKDREICLNYWQQDEKGIWTQKN